MCLGCPPLRCTHRETEAQRGKEIPTHPQLQFAQSGSPGWAGGGPGSVAFSQTLLLSRGPQRLLQETMLSSPPSIVATPHLVFVCSILCVSVWNNSHQAGSAPWEQAANELQMSRPNCLKAGGCSDARADCRAWPVVVEQRTPLLFIGYLIPNLYTAGTSVSPQKPRWRCYFKEIWGKSRKSWRGNAF